MTGPEENLIVPDDTDLAVARLRAERARQRLAGTLVDIQARLNPKALAREAFDELKEAAQEIAREGIDGLKRHPLTLAGVSAAAGLFLARGPLKHLIEVYLDETPEPPESLKPKRARARRKGPSE
ncbi:MAG: hypothetical protein JWN66_2924 [Sphingomonas bacterium]|jgi:ElaB/YqjD/DUF883 family membrane-anchored ribosome-binding protein|uniref:DUF3618 domain-containing protein n=1 Tax=Sphingomonas bacterium TaxID=1895847 RepID=UPI002607C5F2|nr:DUF3618 domain-containing protein [Sphingomonas bacterium]MDB5705808.1 hypothetical protein [Sphingomonas bacterium]